MHWRRSFEKVKTYCHMLQQGYEMGDCLVRMPDGSQEPACIATLQKLDGVFWRLIKSAHLSRPEHYLSIYQSGCNASCLKCHSHEFSQVYNGEWASTDILAEMATDYAQHLTVWEPRKRATTYHATDLCRCCGRCIVQGTPHPLCPQAIEPEQVVISPQGFGPARNIVAFTGGDIACRADFYAEATEKIKAAAPDLWVLLETNGYGLTTENLDLLATAGLDAFWLDIKAHDADLYRRLCGTDNTTVLAAPAEILRRNMVLEVLTVFIPGWVETKEIQAVARLLAGLDPTIPYTILCFFPAYRLQDVSSPTLEQMLKAYQVACEEGLVNVKLGNCGHFARTPEDFDRLIATVGMEGIA
jgi:pyruvate-formate lyase-activating enzyme